MAESDLQPLLKPIEYGHAGAQPYNPFYKHSGKVTFRGSALALIVGLALAIVCGFIYAYADLFIPIVYANLLLCGGFGAAIGAGAAAVLRWGKVRNVPVALAIVGVLSLVAYYVCWDAWIIAVLDRFKVPHSFDYLSLAMHPETMYRIARKINGVGTWTMGSYSSGKDTVSGIALLIVWIVEALGIFGTALWVARKMASDRPFCERCDRWCADDRLVATLSPVTAQTLQDCLLTRDWPYVASLVTDAGGRGAGLHWIELRHHVCPGCNQLNTITAVHLQVRTNRQGKREVVKKVLVDKLIMTADEVAYLKSLPPGAYAVG